MQYPKAAWYPAACWTVSRIPLSPVHAFPAIMACWVQSLVALVLVLPWLPQLIAFTIPRSGLNPFWVLGLPAQHLFPLSASLLGWESDFWQQVISNFTPPRTFPLAISCVCWWRSPYCVRRVQHTDLDKTSHSTFCEISHAQFIKLLLCAVGFLAGFLLILASQRSSRLVKEHKILILKCRDVLQLSHLHNSPSCPEGMSEWGVDKSYP